MKQSLIKISVTVMIVILAIISVVVYVPHTYENGQSTKSQVPVGKSNPMGLTQVLEQTETKLYQEQTELYLEQSNTELYQGMLITVLYPYIQKSVTQYYNNQDVLAPPYMVKVIGATKEQGYEINLEVEPYIGPHDSVGIDHITMRISPEKIEVMNYEHIKSFPLPPNLQDLIQR